MLPPEFQSDPFFSTRGPQRGAIVPMVCLLMPILIILSAFAINFAHMELVRTQAQIASDASVRAAGRTFTLTGKLNDSIQAARSVAAKNSVNGKVLSLPNSSFAQGSSTRKSTAERFDFKKIGGGNSAKPNGLRITVNENGLRYLFPSLTGSQTFGFQRTSTTTQVEVDIVLVLDRSGSMAYAVDEKFTGYAYPQAAPPGWNFGAPAPPKSRWLDLVAASDAFLKYLNESYVSEHVGLTTYGTTASKDRAISSNYSTIHSGIDFYTKNYPPGSTNIADGITKGAELLKNGRPFASKVILVMTDGNRTAGPEPVAVAANLGKEGVIIYAVTFSNEADQVTMKKVAEAGSGMHLHATTSASLQTVFETIARSIPTIITE